LYGQSYVRWGTDNFRGSCHGRPKPGKLMAFATPSMKLEFRRAASAEGLRSSFQRGREGIERQIAE
jgi:hypothetical protein